MEVYSLYIRTLEDQGARELNEHTRESDTTSIDINERSRINANLNTNIFKPDAAGRPLPENHLPPTEPERGHSAKLTGAINVTLRRQAKVFRAENGQCAADTHHPITENPVTNPASADTSKFYSLRTTGQPVMEASFVPVTLLLGIFDEIIF